MAAYIIGHGGAGSVEGKAAGQFIREQGEVEGLAEGQDVLEGFQKGLELYCTSTALLCKSLIINGAGEGNRILVTIPSCVAGLCR
jgi:hypothetical protein